MARLGRRSLEREESSRSSSAVSTKMMDEKPTRKRPRRIARLVSRDPLFSMAKGGDCRIDLSDDRQVPASPAAVGPAAAGKASCQGEADRTPSSTEMLPRDLLGNAAMMRIHIAAIRLEAELFPMRLILSRLMGHSTLNRKGIFNKPVDPVELGIPDYESIVSEPMDLGTIKKRLHAIAYKSRDEVADDVRLTFRNAIRYNPPHNAVHLCAAQLLACFEKWYGSLDLVQSSDSTERAAQAEDGRATVVPALPKPPPESPVAASLHATRSAATKPAGTEAAIVASEAAAVSARAAPPAKQAKPAPKPKPSLPHSCEDCRGRTCAICEQGCLSLEAPLLVCSGSSCGGARIRKGTQFFIAKDGSRQYCGRCYPGLPPVLPNSSPSDSCRYKKDLLKRKNDDEVAEKWIDCSRCPARVHAVCAMHSHHLGSADDFVCPDCRFKGEEGQEPSSGIKGSNDDRFTFLSGSDLPVPLSSVRIGSLELSADALPKCSLASFIEAKAQQQMKDTPNAGKTIAVRVISSCSRYFDIPDVVRRHFRMESERNTLVHPPEKVHYDQKAITLFQKIDGLDVCIFCMYVQEYDGKDRYGSDQDPLDVNARHSRRVYVAYIDSVEHFRPRDCRTQVYQEILVSYLASARARGFDRAQIWACPPSRGSNFIFWNHPASQRTPTQDRLDAWYHNVISRAIDCGVITDVKSLFESDFEGPLKELETEAQEQDQPAAAASGRMVCPPLLDGDFWIDEASRLHRAHIARNIKVRAPTDVCVWNVTPISGDQLDPCPALQVASLLKDRIMTHPSSVQFRRPVNAAALNLVNYDKIVKCPMDLGTIYSRCVLGEYQTFRETVQDVELMVANAKKFNPVGNYVHKQAIEVHDLFFRELVPLTKTWSSGDANGQSVESSWQSFADMSMSLDVTVNIPSKQSAEPITSSVVIEDDLTSNGSQSLGSSLSTPSFPASLERMESHDTNDSTVLRALRKARCPPKRKAPKVKQLKPVTKLDLLSDGPDAVFQSMVGADTWLLDRSTASHASMQKTRTRKRRQRHVRGSSVTIEPVHKKRRQSWLGEEVCHSVRRMRTSFFSCSLTPHAVMSDVEKAKAVNYGVYVDDYDHSEAGPGLSSPITDARYALLEFSQFRHLEFDTLRKAKYSTAILLYHLHNPKAPGAEPTCTTCEQAIEDVRWHKMTSQVQRKPTAVSRPGRKGKKLPVAVQTGLYTAEELCCGCHAQCSNGAQFIPIPVSFKPQQEGI